MQIPGNLIGGLFKAVGLVPKRPKIGASAPIPTRSDAAASARIDALRARRGGSADFLTGAAGAEAAPVGVKELLGQ
jgi:hypothetical protein